jgi:2-amino-4-hydroxy-6-hydroxymethyldihydropteridine diphosphokinase
MMKQAFLLLGTNLGDRNKSLLSAMQYIAGDEIEVEQTSSIYETAAWGKTDQQNFLNQVIEISTNLSSTALLEKILAIEKQIGRIRKEMWGERIIDIDILYYANEVIKSQRLVIPHPYLHERRFTLEPLHEIAPNFVHPVFNKTTSSLLNECKDLLEVRKIT